MSTLRCLSTVRISAITINNLKPQVPVGVICEKFRESSTSNASTTTTTFRKVYELPLIRIPRTVNRLKLYQTQLSAFAITSTEILQALDIIPRGIDEPVLGLGIIGCVMFHTLGFLCNNIVGAIYLSEDCATVKLSYLNFWGKRVDETCATKDIVPLSELPDRPYDPYIKLQRYSTTVRLKISLKYGRVVDDKHFRYIFGEIDYQPQ